MTTDSVTQSGPVPTYRVVQWATGNVGSRALRRVIEHPFLELVGVYVHSAEKAGRDAGEICGVAPVGIIATRNIEDVIALRADCILYMPHILNLDELCRLLESGANIVTTRTEFQNPDYLDSGIRARVEQACQRGRTSLHGTGISPGFITEAMPIVLMSIQRRLDHLAIHEFGNNVSRNSPEMLFDVMGFGEKPGRPVQPRLDHLRDAFGPSLALVAKAVGLPLDSIDVSGELGLAREDTPIAAGMVSAGTVAAMKTIVTGRHNGKSLMTFTATWFVSTNIETSDGQTWEFRDSGWNVRVDGDCPLDITIGFPVAPEHYADMTPGLTAHRPVNVIPYLCEAAPGIRTTVDLPQIIARLG